MSPSLRFRSLSVLLVLGLLAVAMPAGAQDADSAPPPPAAGLADDADAVEAAAPLRAAIYILAPIGRVWDAITLKQHADTYYMTTLTSDSAPRVDAPWRYGSDESPVILGKVTAVERPARFSHTFTFSFLPEMGETAVDYELTPVREGVTYVTITHSRLPADNEQLVSDLRSGWEQIASALKSYLETGVGISNIGAPEPTAPAYDVPGLLITEFAEESAARAAGLQVGDLIVAYGDHATPTVEALRAAVAAVQAAGTTEAIVSALRGDDKLSAELPVGLLGVYLQEVGRDPFAGLTRIGPADLAWDHAATDAEGYERYTSMAMNGEAIGAERQWWRYADGVLSHRSTVAMRFGGELYTHTTALSMPAGPDGMHVRSFRIEVGPGGEGGETTVVGNSQRVVATGEAGLVTTPLLDGEIVCSDFAAEWLATLMPWKKGRALKLTVLLGPTVNRDTVLVAVGPEPVPGEETEREAWRVELRYGGGNSVFWIDPETRRLVRADYNGPVATPVDAEAGAASLGKLIGG
jgi:uncharacterized protein YndB with AHSA1/START domain